MKPLNILLHISVVSLALATPVFAQGTTFTYQGQLDDGDSPADGSYDLGFALYDLQSGGSQQGNIITFPATAIRNGLFTVALDFGAGVFDGSDRWLEIAVRTNGGGAFQPLSPRQRITSAPYAIKAAGVLASGITGTLAVSQLPGVVLTNGAAGVSLAGSFTGNAGGLSNLNSASLTGPLSVDAGRGVALGQVNNGGTARGLAVAGNYAYLANSGDGLRVYDISGPGDPVNVGAINNGGEAQGVAIVGNYAYVANGSDGLRIYSVSSPANPVNVGRTNNGGSAYGVAVSGNYAYVANGSDGLRIYSVSDPASPVNVGRTNNGEIAYGVAVSGNYAYLANGFDNLRIYSVANPASPVLVGSWNGPGESLGVAVAGNFAYLANRADGLRIFNVSNPTNPVPVGQIPAVGTGPRGVTVQGGYVYVATGPDGLRAYDAGNPANLIEIGHYNDLGPGEAGWAAVPIGDRIALACGFGGLRMIRFGIIQAPRFAALGGLTIAGQDALEFGAGLAGKEQNAGKILYQRFSDGLDIVGAGTNVASRRIQFYAEGGATFTGPITATSAAVAGSVTAANAAFAGPVAAASFSGNGAGLTNLNLAAASGSLSDARLSANVALLNRSSQIFTGTNSFSGRVGIGTTTPITPLTVIGTAGNVRVSALFSDAVNSTFRVAHPSSQVVVIGGNVDHDLQLGGFVNDLSAFVPLVTIKKSTLGGNVGIGVSDPGLNDVQINPWFHSANGYGLQVNRADFGANIQINRTAGQGGIGLVVDNSANGDSSTSLLLVRDNVGTSAQTIMNVRADGRTLVRELEITGGADVSEPFDVTSDQKVEPGMVVVIDPDRLGELRVCTEAYDRTVAGIISGANGIRPGLVLKQKDSAADGKHPVALSGRVWCYCDASKAGAIRPGDLLTTSDTLGHAMKATDRERAFGAILGKAMSCLESGTGLVLVLVRPQ